MALTKLHGNMIEDGTVSPTHLHASSKSVVVQRVLSSTGAVATGTTITPSDDTVPTSSEGTEFMTANITPTSATNYLDISGVVHASASTSGRITVAVFVGASATPISVAGQAIANNNNIFAIPFRARVVAGSTSELTIRVRAGLHNAGTVTFNGEGGNRLYGGSLVSYIEISEIKA